MAEPIRNGDEQLNITPFLTKFTDFAKKHAYFRCQRLTEFIEVLLNIQSAVFGNIAKRCLPLAR
jgi:hypothetical protein